TPAPGQHRQAAQQAADGQVDDRNDHSAMIPGRQPAQAQSSNRAPQVLADPDDVRYRAINGVEIVRAGGGCLSFRSRITSAPLPWVPAGRAEYNRAMFLNLLGLRLFAVRPSRATRSPAPTSCAALLGRSSGQPRDCPPYIESSSDS